MPETTKIQTPAVKFVVDHLTSQRTSPQTVLIHGAPSAAVEIYRSLPVDFSGGMKFIGVDLIDQGVPPTYVSSLPIQGLVALQKFAKERNIELVVNSKAEPALIRYAKLDALTGTAISPDNLRTIAKDHGVQVNNKVVDEAVKAFRSLNTIPEGTWTISAGDRSYLPVAFAGIRCQQYDLLVVTGAENLPIVHRKLIARLVRKTGMLVLIGDPSQPIKPGVRPGFLDALAKQPGVEVFKRAITIRNQAEKPVELPQITKERSMKLAELGKDYDVAAGVPVTDDAPAPKAGVPVKVDLSDMITRVREISGDSGKLHISTFKTKLEDYLASWEETAIGLEGGMEEVANFRVTVEAALATLGTQARVASLIRKLEEAG